MSFTEQKITVIQITTISESLCVFFPPLVRFLRARGVTVHAVSAPGELLHRFGEQEQITVHAIPMARRIAPWHDLASLWQLVRLLRRLRPRIVHSHTPKGGLLGMIGAYCAGIPVRVYTIHGLPMVTATGMKRRLLRLAEVVACRLAHRVLCVSASNRALAVAEGLCPAEKITVLGQGSICGVDAQKFCPIPVDAPVRLATRRAYGIPATARVIGFVGRIVRDKGIQELAAAWLALRGTRSPMRICSLSVRLSHRIRFPTLRARRWKAIRVFIWSGKHSIRRRCMPRWMW